MYKTRAFITVEWLEKFKYNEKFTKNIPTLKQKIFTNMKDKSWNLTKNLKTHYLQIFD